MNRSHFLFLALSALACTSTARVGTDISRPSVDATRIAQDIQSLASDAFRGRGPATPGEELTVNYIRDRLQAAGVQPGGPNGSWFQEVPLLK